MRQGKKHSEIQISRSSNIGAAFFGKSNTGKAQTNGKDPASNTLRAEPLEPLRGGSLLFTTKFPEIPGTSLIDLGRMKS